MRPEWCPEDVWETATNVCTWAEPLYDEEVFESERDEVVEAVAEAILAERERCGIAQRPRMPDNDLEQIIADQMAQIEQLRAELAKSGEEVGDPYWTGIYDNIRAAWDKWALAELGTASPSPLDLQGRPELMALWEAVR